MSRDSGPVAFEDGSGVGVELALKDGLPARGAFQAQFQAADAREEAGDAECHVSPAARMATHWLMIRHAHSVP